MGVLVELQDPQLGESQLGSALAGSGAAVALLRGQELLVEYANPTHRRMFGWQPGGSLRRAAAVGAGELTVLADQVLSAAQPAHAEVPTSGGRTVQAVCSPVSAGTANYGVLMVAVDATDQVEARRRAEDHSERLAVLDQATVAVTADLDLRRELTALANSVVPSLADACTIYLIDQHQRREITAAGRLYVTRLVCVIDPAMGVQAPAPEIRLRLADTRPMYRAVTTRQAVPAHGAELREQIWGEAWLHTLAPHSLVALPLGRPDVLAVVNFLACGDRPPYQPSDLSLMREITARADIAVGHAQRLQVATETALALQRGLLSDPAGADWLDIAVRYRPAEPGLEVGGDWYDSLTLPAGDLGLTVGDVVGHDLYAVSTMGQLRSMVQTLACQPGADPGSVLTGLNDLCLHLGTGRYATLVHGRLTRSQTGPGGTFTWANAGHPPPLVTPPNGPTTELHRPPSPLLGLTAVSYDQATVPLPPGSLLLLYTDGLIENPTRPDSDPIGVLGAAITAHAALDLEDLCDKLVADAPAADDIALLAVRVRP